MKNVEDKNYWRRSLHKEKIISYFYSMRFIKRRAARNMYMDTTFKKNEPELADMFI